MNQDDELDPLADLREWARRTERKVTRQRRLGGLVSKLRYVVMAVVIAGMIGVAVPLVRTMRADDAAVAPEPSASFADPFAGTVASAYPVGAKGIALPAAKAVEGFTTAQVQAALDKVGEAMRAARLDPDMIVEHRPDDLLGMLAPASRAQIATWFTSEAFDNVATWIDPAVELDPLNQPRVSGRVAYRSVVEDEVRRLRVTTNFVWVYAFRGEFADRPLAVEHDRVDWDFPRTDHLRVGDQGMWIHRAVSYSAWVDCAAMRKGLLAPAPKGATGLPAGEDPDALANPDHPLEIAGDCP